jgi:hypothetical protein
MPVVAIPTLSSKGWCIVTPEYCHQCQRITPGTAFKVSSGHIVNACAICRAARKGRPYLPQWAYELFEFENSRPMPYAGQMVPAFRQCPQRAEGNTMSQDEKFFQFPLCLLTYGATVKDRCNAIIRYCLIHEGLKAVDRIDIPKAKELLAEMGERKPYGCDIKNRTDRAYLVGANVLNVVGGSVPDAVNTHGDVSAYCREYEAATQGRDAQVRIKTSLIFETRDGSYDARQFAVLCGLYSLIGSKPYPVVCRREVIALRAYGYKSKAAMDAWNARRANKEEKLLTVDQIRYTLDALEVSGWFARVQASKRNVYFSHRMTREQMLMKLANKIRIKAKPAINRAEERDFFQGLGLNRCPVIKAGNPDAGDASNAV